jgi:hypothetical protein
MDFDGTADYIDCGSASYLNGLSKFSLSCWFNLNTAASNKTIASDWFYNTGVLGHFALQTTNTSGSNYGLLFLVKQTSDSGNNYVTTTAVLTENTWYHAVFTYDSGTVICYIDGVGPVSLTTQGTIPSTLTTQDGNLNIGKFGGSLTRFWDGKLSNVAIWNSALTQDQVLTIYNGGVPNSISSLSPIGWWSLAGDSYYNGSDWICPDLGSGGNNGTSSGMGGSELVGNAPGGSANGTATNMDIPSNLKGDAPNSSSNAFSVNMDSQDRVASVPS